MNRHEAHQLDDTGAASRGPLIIGAIQPRGGRGPRPAYPHRVQARDSWADARLSVACPVTSTYNRKSWQSWGTPSERGRTTWRRSQELSRKDGGRADPRRLRVPDGVEEVTAAYVELAAEMAVSLGELARHLDEVGQALRGNAKNSEAADDALADLFKGGKG